MGLSRDGVVFYTVHTSPHQKIPKQGPLESMEYHILICHKVVSGVHGVD